MQQKEMKKLLENNNFKNNQNYTFSKELQDKYHIFFQKTENYNKKYAIVDFENEKLEEKSAFLSFFLLLFLMFILPLIIIFLVIDDKSWFYTFLNILKNI